MCRTVIGRGDSAIEFTLPGTEGEQIQKYSLSDHTEEGAVVLVFYPFDFSPVCADELCTIRDAEWLTLTPGIDVFGISLDSCHAHKQFMSKHDLHFPLLSDTVGRVTEEYGLAYDEWDHHAGVPKRALVTIDDTDTVRYTWMTDNALDKPSYDELHQTVTSLENS